MKPSTELFDLIKSLSKSEKRFFKLSSSLQTGEKNYLKLFDYIDKQFEYDEAAIKKAFAREKFINHLPSEKNHLYKLILKSLRGFHGDSSIGSILHQEIKNVEILYKKALYKECKKFLKRAKSLAQKHDKFYYWFELISWEKQLIEEEYEQGIFTYNLDKLIQEELDVIEKLRNLAEYQMIYSRINYIFRSGIFAKNESERKEVDEISNHHLIKGKNTAISDTAASICYYIQGLCNITNRDFVAAREKLLKTKSILDRNTNIRQDLPIRYVRTLKNLIFANITLKDLGKAQELIYELQECSKYKGFNSLDVKVKIFTFSSNTQIMIYDRLGQFEEALPTVREMENGLSTFRHKLSKEQSILFYYNIAYIYFGVGQYKEALKWINKILNDNEQTLRQDVYNFSRIFNLIIHYELGNYELIEYLYKSANRQIRKTKKNFSADEYVLKFMNRLAKTDEINKEGLFQNGKTELLALYENPDEAIIQEYFDFLSWLDAKIEKIPFSEAVKRKPSLV